MTLRGTTERSKRRRRSTYRGYTVHKAGFWNQGPVLLQTLGSSRDSTWQKMGIGSADALHTITEAIKLAFADRDHYYGDPDFVKVPGARFSRPAYAAVRRGADRSEAGQPRHRPGDPERGTARADSPACRRQLDLATAVPGETTVTRPRSKSVDREGNLFSATPSSGWLLGGAFVAGDTGVPMSNRMQAFRSIRRAPTSSPVESVRGRR